MNLPTKFLSIDEEGFPHFGELRVTDVAIGAELLRNLDFAENGALVTSLIGETAFIEAFDEPLVAQMVMKRPAGWFLMLNYGVEIPFDPRGLTVDEWDRFHGRSQKGIPFILSRKAQTEFFNLVDEFDDDSITVDGRKLPMRQWLEPNPEVQEPIFWDACYRNFQNGWELDDAAPAFKDMVPRLKLQKSRVLVLGCGSGNDAALFAEEGHIVTAVDFSEEALDRAKKKYGHLQNIKWVKADAFHLPKEFVGAFDILVEHTFYCAIDPSKRQELVQVWKRCLIDKGFLLGVFFVMDYKKAPPYGGLEWEVRERLKKDFHFIFWGRLKDSVQNRLGKELLVYAHRK